MDTLKYYEAQALSNKDVLKLLDNKAKVVLYPELHKFHTIDELLHPYDAVFLLYELKPQYGHWTCLFKRGKEVEFFNSYGGIPDETLKKIPNTYKSESHQNFPYLVNLLYNSPYEIHYNEYDFQKHSPDVKTCGRWAALRLLMKDFTIDEFKHVIDLLKDYLSVSADKVVTILTTI